MAGTPKADALPDPGTAARLPYAMHPRDDEDADSFEDEGPPDSEALQTEAEVTCPHCREAMSI